MIRHKYYFHYNNWNIFDELKEMGGVKMKYKYSYSKKNKPGAVFIATENGHEHISIATNCAVTYYGGGYRNRTYRKFRYMFLLTKEGWEYLKEKALIDAFFGSL